MPSSASPGAGRRGRRTHRSDRSSHPKYYRISKYGVAAQTGKSLQWGADVLAGYRHTYPVLIQW
jgi:hypothetical protein